MGFLNKVGEGKRTPNSKAEPNGPERWHHVLVPPTSNTPKLIAPRRRVSVRKAAIITGNKHLNTCAFLPPQNMAPCKWESSGARTCWKGFFSRQSSSVSTTSSSQRGEKSKSGSNWSVHKLSSKFHNGTSLQGLLLVHFNGTTKIVEVD